MTEHIRLVLVDDHSLFRNGLAELLGTFDDLHVVGQGENTEDAWRITEQFQPEVAVVDVGMPGPGPVETLHGITQRSPGTRVITVTMFDDPRLIRELITAGASGYLLKSSDPLELVTAIRAAVRSSNAVFVSITRPAFVELTTSVQPSTGALSAREVEVLTLLSEARTNRDIGRQLHISDATVKRHLSNIYAKLNATTRAEAIRIARHTGLVLD